MAKILISAFEPFGGESVNASANLLEQLQQQKLDNHQLVPLLLPVEGFSAPEKLLQAWQATRPDYLLMLGEAGGRAHITPERIAVNLDDFPIEDNAGNQPRDKPVVAGAAAAYFSTLPVREMVQQMQAAGVPAELSNSAGLYVCNRVFYCAMHYLHSRGATTRAGFMHLPWLPEQVANKPAGTASMEAPLQLKGILAAIAALT